MEFLGGIHMKNLLKESFELFCKKNWLRIIHKECDKYNKLKSKLNRQQYVVNALVKRYKGMLNCKAHSIISG